jgi:predicted ABC-type ATPase
MDGPNLILLAGPNGAGKTTASSDLLAGVLNVHYFVNADEIALDPGGEHAAMAAGHIMLERLRDLTDQRANVSFESNLSSRTFAPWIRRLKDSGYTFTLFYFWIPNPDMAVDRVRRRTKLGGHSVPEADIRRRYHRGLSNFFKLYSPLAIEWEFYDNTESKPRLIASCCPEKTLDAALWDRIQKEARHGDR